MGRCTHGKAPDMTMGGRDVIVTGPARRNHSNVMCLQQMCLQYFWVVWNGQPGCPWSFGEAVSAQNLQVCPEGRHRSRDYKKSLPGEGHFHLLGAQVPPLWANPILNSVQGRAQAVGQLVGLSCHSVRGHSEGEVGGPTPSGAPAGPEDGVAWAGGSALLSLSLLICILEMVLALAVGVAQG